MNVYSIDQCFYEIRNGANIKQGVISGGYPITRIETLSNDMFNREKMGYAGIKNLDKYYDYILSDGDLLMSHINSPQYLGRTVMYRQKDDEVILHGMNLLRLKANKEIINPRYAELLFYSNPIRKQIARIAKKSVNQASFSVNDLKKIRINLPQLDKQISVSNKMDLIKALINKQKREIYELDNLIKSRFVEMFGDIEETCEIGYYIKSLIAGKSLVGEAECVNKVLKTGAASFDYFDGTQIKNLPLDYEPKIEHLVNVGDVIISRMNTAELTGASAYVWDVSERVYLPDRLWKAVLDEKCNPIFVWQMLIQPSTKERIQRECSGTSGSMKNISKTGMLGIKVKKAPFELQNDFATFVQQVDKSKFAIQKSIDETQKLYNALMQKYFG